MWLRCPLPRPQEIRGETISLIPTSLAALQDLPAGITVDGDIVAAVVRVGVLGGERRPQHLQGELAALQGHLALSFLRGKDQFPPHAHCNYPAVGREGTMLHSPCRREFSRGPGRLRRLQRGEGYRWGDVTSAGSHLGSGGVSLQPGIQTHWLPDPWAKGPGEDFIAPKHMGHMCTTNSPLGNQRCPLCSALPSQLC